MPRLLPWFLATLLACGSAAAADLTRGEALFRQHCASCHTKPERLRLPAGGLGSVLDRRDIPAHRLARLSESEQEDVAAYLRSLRR